MSCNKVKLNIVSHGFHYKCDFSDANRQQINESIVKNEIIQTKYIENIRLRVRTISGRNSLLHD